MRCFSEFLAKTAQVFENFCAVFCENCEKQRIIFFLQGAFRTPNWALVTAS